MTNLRPTIQERAYQLAEEAQSIPAIRKQLMAERYDDVDAQLSPPNLRLTLKRLCRAAKARRAAAD